MNPYTEFNKKHLKVVLEDVAKIFSREVIKSAKVARLSLRNRNKYSYEFYLPTTDQFCGIRIESWASNIWEARAQSWEAILAISACEQKPREVYVFEASKETIAFLRGLVRVTKTELEQRGGSIAYIPDCRFFEYFDLSNEEGGIYQRNGDYFLERTGYGYFDFFRGVHYVLLKNVGGLDDGRSEEELKDLMDEINSSPGRFVITEDFEVARLCDDKEKDPRMRLNNALVRLLKYNNIRTVIRALADEANLIHNGIAKDLEKVANKYY